MASRRLQSEIEKVVKEARASLELYDERWEELRDFNRTQVGVKEKMWEECRREQLRGKKHAVRTATLELLDFKHVCDSKAKMESDMEGTLKRLHRYRQQLTEWLSCTELRTQFDELRDLRKQIELRYKRGRVFYRQGLSSDDCNESDPNGESALQWIPGFIEKLKLQADAWEADVESLTRKLNASPDKNSAEGKASLDSVRDKKAQLEAFVDLHKMHVKRLEALLRALRSRAVTLTESQGEEVYEALSPYIEENKDLTIVVADEIYHDIHLPAYCSSESGTETMDEVGQGEANSPMNLTPTAGSLETLPKAAENRPAKLKDEQPDTEPISSASRKPAWGSPGNVGAERSPVSGRAWTKPSAPPPDPKVKVPDFPDIKRLPSDGVKSTEVPVRAKWTTATTSNPVVQPEPAKQAKKRSVSSAAQKRIRSNPAGSLQSVPAKSSCTTASPQAAPCHPIADIDIAVCDWVYEGKGTASDQATMDKTCRVKKGDKLYIVKVDSSGWTFAYIDNPELVPSPVICGENGQKQLSPEAAKKLNGGWFPDSARANRVKTAVATSPTAASQNAPVSEQLVEQITVETRQSPQLSHSSSASTTTTASKTPTNKSLLRRLNIVGSAARRKASVPAPEGLSETCQGILRLIDATDWADAVPMLSCFTIRVIKWSWHEDFLVNTPCQCSRRVMRDVEQRVLDDLFTPTQSKESLDTWSSLSFLNSADLLHPATPCHQYLSCEAGDQVYIEEIANGWVLGTCLATGKKGWFPTYLLASPTDLMAGLVRLVESFSAVSDLLPPVASDFPCTNAPFPNGLTRVCDSLRKPTIIQ
eukprot:Blabericola_migrator_1__3014@NODE_1876_length_3615_cov_430_362740_g1201_i0_p1_GENE_NODE_1876_length_3615_cov_430_362740_g1201_i0NODE_1876_length_3615_cov_430_362740_g1201_i0_p1_ORF_typecomplete_len818_score110_20Not3/PF04065_15/1_8e37SH3_1/PF00018_28/0_12SH3_1/PF00018_28/0_0002SH3_2/PF07653_17/0_24SH3_2/PF07653_17/0_00043SH3_9/PF14604_6/34SH3_9/PF14604_6/0_00048HBM/PF16591_5/17HBM/PF16591_5/1_9e03HBM/PF16591_5/10OmpH/PF03938_14/5_9e03OmpH/PF03938_14/6_8e03OmpH/PF03938_14/0_19AAA_13/PF13166_6/3DU